jgi:hypothetical protein
MKGTAMYTVYIGPRGTGGLRKAQLSSKRFSSLPEALIWAHDLSARGNSVIRLEGDDGTDLNRNDLACAFRLLAINDDFDLVRES